LGWTQLDLASELKTYPQVVASWENGLHNPHAAFQKKLKELQKEFKKFKR
jgi:ribosome-binding protein aMBF1 (putative translation factor)